MNFGIAACLIRRKMVKIFAHRGSSKEAPENTLKAFEIAIEEGVDGIELDVQLTKDGEIVVIHDETIDRVSNGNGYVKDYTLEELRQFSFHNHMKQFEGIKIPTLEEVLELMRPTDLKINIELKTSIIWYPDIEKKVVNLVKEKGMMKQIIYSSFNHYSIKKILELDPLADTAFLMSDVILDAPRYAINAGVKGIHPAVCQMDMDGVLKQYIESPCEIRVWTVDHVEMIKKMIQNGVEAIITNYPQKALNIRDQ